MNKRIEELRQYRRAQDTPPLVRKLTVREERAILALDELFKTWPDTLEFQAGTGGLNVLVLNPRTRECYLRNAFHRCGSEQLDPASVAASFDVRAQGGDPW